MAEERFSDLSVQAFLAALASDRPAPGGGAAAALAAAAAAGLVEMVCRFSEGRQQYAEWSAQLAAALETAGRLRQELQAALDADAAAFAAVSAAYALPRVTKEHRATRRTVVADALAAAAVPPLQVATAAATLGALAHSLVGHSNAQLVSDLGAAGALLEAALTIARYNVEANSRALKDDARARVLRDQLKAELVAATMDLRALREAVDLALVGEGAG